MCIIISNFLATRDRLYVIGMKEKTKFSIYDSSMYSDNEGCFGK